jgi:hypothetical protein
MPTDEISKNARNRCSLPALTSWAWLASVMGGRMAAAGVSALSDFGFSSTDISLLHSTNVFF